MNKKPTIVEIFLHTDVFTPIKANQRLGLISNREGKTYIPLFTSQEQYDKWNIHEKTMQLPLPQFDTILQTENQIDGIVLNPFDQNIIYTKEEIHKALQEDIPFTQNEAIIIQEIQKDLPLLSFLLKTFEQNEKVQEAYVVKMIREINEEESYLVILDAKAYSEALCQEIASQTLSYLKSGEKLDFLSTNSDLGHQIAQSQIPVYIKKDLALS